MKTKTMIYLEPEQHQALIDEARKEKISLAALIRKAVEQYLHKAGDKSFSYEEALSIVGMGASGVKDVSRHHDEYLAEAIEKDWMKK